MHYDESTPAEAAMAKDTTVYFKVLNLDGTACHGGRDRWALPVNDQPGDWMPDISDPKPCMRGYHLCRDMSDLLWSDDLAGRSARRGYPRHGQDRS
jgi:hypothetical protein